MIHLTYCNNMVVLCGPGQEFKSWQGLKFMWELVRLIHGSSASLWAYPLSCDLLNSFHALSCGFHQ